MKRIVIVCILLVFCVAVSAHSWQRVGEVNDNIFSEVEGALDAIADADQNRIEQHCHNLSEYWDVEEDRLIHLIRHAQIDDITKSIARLEALAAGEDYSELTAELMSIRWQMDHIRRSEQLIFANLL